LTYPLLRFSGTPRFEVVRFLGAGGMGEVYEVLDREHDARLAAKVMRRLDAHVLYRFKREFRIVQELAHPNLAALGELHELGGLWFFTMELVDGVDFLHHVRDPAFDEVRLRAALRQLCEALAFLHAHGKVHRDVKPTNVLVTPAGRVVLLDFGLSPMPIPASSRATTSSARRRTWRPSRRRARRSTRAPTATRSARSSSRR
jgi:eukaryotic-like serine/threonine-protein kinase